MLDPNPLAGGLSIADSELSIYGSADGTKKLVTQVDTQATASTLTLDVGAQTASRTLTVPVLTGDRTLAVLDQAQTFTAAQTFAEITATTGAFSGAVTASSLTAGGLTSGRVPFVTTAGLITDSAALTFDAVAQTMVVGSGGATSPLVVVNGAAGTNREFRFQTAGVNRWRFGVENTAESGSDTGSTFIVRALSDAGALIDSPITILRAAGGAITIARPVTITGAATLSSTLAVTGGDITSSRSSNGATLIAIGNTSAGTLASSRFRATNDSTAQIDFTTYGSGNTNTLFGITLANYSALFTQGAASNGLLLGHFGGNKPIIFGINASEVGRFTGGTLATDSFAIKYTTASISTTTGALVVSGGVGIAGACYVGGALAVTGALAVSDALAMTLSSAATTGSTTTLTLTHNSSGTPTAGFGSNIQFRAKTSTTTSINCGQIEWVWADATHASRKSRAIHYVNDFGGAREAFRLEASGTAAMIGFLGASAVARTSLAAASGTATRTTYDTATVTLPQLAERVKAIIDDLRSYGLEG